MPRVQIARGNDDLPQVPLRENALECSRSFVRLHDELPDRRAEAGDDGAHVRQPPAVPIDARPGNTTLPVLPMRECIQEEICGAVCGESQSTEDCGEGRERQTEIERAIGEHAIEDHRPVDLRGELRFRISAGDLTDFAECLHSHRPGAVNDAV